MASLAAHGIEWHLQTISAGSDASTTIWIASSDVQAHCYCSSDDLTLLGEYVLAAEHYLKRRIRGGRQFISKTRDLVMDSFPPSDKVLEVPLPPLQSVTSISYYDDGNSAQTYASTSYTVFTPEKGRGFIKPIPDEIWPGTYGRRDAVTVRFVSGYGLAAANIPLCLKQAGKMLVAHWYRYRETAMQNPPREMEHAIDALLATEDWGYY